MRNHMPLVMLLAIAAACVLWPLIDGVTLAADMLGQMMWHIAALLVCIVWYGLITKRYLTACIAVLLAGVALGSIWLRTDGLHHASHAKPDAVQRFSLLSYNLWKDNRSQLDVVALIRSTSPDIIWLQEVHRAPYYNIAEALPDYYHYPPLDKAAAQGSVLLSRFPLASSFIPQRVPYRLHARLVLPDDHVLDMIGVHLRSPRSQDKLDERQQQLHALTDYVQGINTGNVVVAGDFNTAPWRPIVGSFARKNMLQPAYSMMQPYGSWPAWLPSWLRIPIDTVFYGNRLVLRDMTRLEFVGSDHMPVFASFTYHPS